MKGRSLNPGKLADHIAAVAALVAVWWAWTTFAEVPAFLLPAPDAVWRAFFANALSGDLWPQLGFTLGNILIGLGAGTILGVAAGYVLGVAPVLERWVEGPLLILQTAPKIALAPLFVIWFGLGYASKIVLIASLVLFPVLVATLVGVRSVDPRLRDFARIIRLSRWRRMWRIDLPCALPDIFVGFRIGAIQAIVGAILGEWMSGRRGLGSMMTFAAATYKTSLLFATVLVVVALGITIHALLGLAERRLLAWKA